jgi:hypothetical protein
MFIVITIIYFYLGEEDSKTSAKEDLKSYEEAAPTIPNTQLVPRSLEVLKNGDMLKKGRIQLVCIIVVCFVIVTLECPCNRRTYRNVSISNSYIYSIR